MELLTKPYSKQQKKATPIFPPHTFEKSRSLSPVTCHMWGRGGNTEAAPGRGLCPGRCLGGRSRGGEEAYGGLEML